LKEIVSIRGGTAPSALQPVVGSERNLESTNHVVAAASSEATPIDRRELRAAVGDLSQCLDLAGDEAVQSSVSNEDPSANISAKTSRIIRALALEDASTCCALFLIYSHIFVYISHWHTRFGSVPPEDVVQALHVLETALKSEAARRELASVGFPPCIQSMVSIRA
jgi:hypothetical protein